MTEPPGGLWELSNEPLYNIRAVVEATGIPAPTLRSWERRYGIPAPNHNDRGYRLYSERDIALTRWLHMQVEKGLAISRAVALLQDTKPAQRAALPTTRPPDPDGMVTALMHAMCGLDEEGASRVIAEALRSVPVEDVLLRILQPALYRVGELWAEGALTVTVERFGSNLVRGYLAQMMHITASPVRGERVLIGCAPGEQHELGPLMLALFMRRAGFEVLYAGANLEMDSLLADVDDLRPAAICLGASTAPAVPPLAELFRRLQDQYRGIRAFGGQAFIQDPKLIDSVPGQYLGPDAVSAVASLRSALTGIDLR